LAAKAGLLSIYESEYHICVFVQTTNSKYRAIKGFEDEFYLRTGRQSRRNHNNSERKKLMKFYKSIISTAAVLCTAVFFAACGTASNTTVNTSTMNRANTTANATANTAPANTMANKEVTKDTTPAGDTVGVAECDEYIKKYEACLTKIAAKAPQAEAPLKAAFQAQRDGFKKGAETPQGKAALATGCKQALDSAKSNPALSAYACEW
jgi:hypothetical protein